MLKKFLVVLVFLFLISGFLHPITSINQDLGRHILIGEMISKSFEVPKTNLLSYTNPEFPFINHHWLSEVLYFFTTKLFDFNGLLLLSVALVALSFFLVFVYSYKNFAFIPLLFVSFLSIKILFERTDVRPEIFSFLFISIFITILFKNKERFTRLIFLLPFIELLWVNIHIYFIVGIVIIGLFFIDEVLVKRKEILKILTHKPIPSSTKWLFLILILSILLTLFNPNGVKGAIYPFQVFNNYGYTIEENQTVFFLWNYARKETIVYFGLSFLILLLSLLLTLKKTRPIDWLLTIVFSFLAIQAIRNFPLFVFAVFIPFARSMSILQKTITPKITLRNKKIIMTIFYIIFIFLIILNLNSLVITKTINIGLEKGAKNALDFFEKNNLKGPIFNNFDNGSYIAYRLYPREKVFIDGRPEAYPKEFFSEIYKSMQLNHDVFKTHEKNYGFNTIIFAHTDQTEWGIIFLKNIISNPTWSIVFLDDSTIILVKNNKQNDRIIKKFALNETTYQANLARLSNPELFRLTGFFQKAGWTKKENSAFQEIASRDPSSCIALFNLARIALQANDPSSSIYIDKYNTLCK